MKNFFPDFRNTFLIFVATAKPCDNRWSGVPRSIRAKLFFLRVRYTVVVYGIMARAFLLLFFPFISYFFLMLLLR